jgi:hypothetical protein
VRRVGLSSANAIWLGIGLVLAVSLVLPPSVASGQSLGLRRFLTPAIGTRWRIAQHFRMNAPNLHAVEIRAAQVGPAAGNFRLVLRDLDIPGIERSEQVSAAALLNASRYVFEFAPIPDSKDHAYELEITTAGDNPGRGVALWATKGQPPETGHLIIERPRWARLVFQTYPRGEPYYRLLLGASEPAGPPRWLGLAGLLAAWLAIWPVLHAVKEGDGVPSRDEGTNRTESTSK